MSYNVYNHITLEVLMEKGLQINTTWHETLPQKDKNTQFEVMVKLSDYNTCGN